MRNALFTFLGICFLFFLNSCSDTGCERCVVQENGEEYISIGHLEIIAKFWNGYNSHAINKNNYTLHIAQVDHSIVLPVLAKEYNSAFTIKSEDILSLIIFVDESSMTTREIKKENVLGYQIYAIENSHLVTKVYEIKTTTPKLIDDLDSYVKYISTTDIYKVSTLFHAENKGVYILDNTNTRHTTYSQNRSNLKSNLVTYQKNTTARKRANSI